MNTRPATSLFEIDATTEVAVLHRELYHRKVLIDGALPVRITVTHGPITRWLYPTMSERCDRKLADLHVELCVSPEEWTLRTRDTLYFEHDSVPPCYAAWAQVRIRAPHDRRFPIALVLNDLDRLVHEHLCRVAHDHGVAAPVLRPQFPI